MRARAFASKHREICLIYVCTTNRLFGALQQRSASARHKREAFVFPLGYAIRRQFPSIAAFILFFSVSLSLTYTTAIHASTSRRSQPPISLPLSLPLSLAFLSRSFPQFPSFTVTKYITGYVIAASLSLLREIHLLRDIESGNEHDTPERSRRTRASLVNI